MNQKNALKLIKELAAKAVTDEVYQFPEFAQRAWFAFLEIAACRHFDNGRPQPIRFSEILAWSQLKRIELEPFDIDIISAIDNAMLESVNTLNNGTRHKSLTAMTASDLDRTLGI